MTPDQLRSLTVKDLRTLAEGHGIARAAKLAKPELLDALMPLVARPAAPVPSAPPAGSSMIAAAAAPAPASANSPDPGLPIPETYGADRLVLLVQDPHHVFAYWELTPDHLERVRASAGSSATPVLVLHTAGGSEQREVDLGGGNYYLAVAPSAHYHAELALRDGHGHLHLLANSNRVSTPASSISPRTDERWMGVSETFHELLALAGLPGQAGGATGSDSSLARLLATAPQTATWSVEQLAGGGLAAGGSSALSSTSLSSATLSSATLHQP